MAQKAMRAGIPATVLISPNVMAVDVLVSGLNDVCLWTMGCVVNICPSLRVGLVGLVGLVGVLLLLLLLLFLSGTDAPVACSSSSQVCNKG